MLLRGSEHDLEVAGSIPALIHYEPTGIVEQPIDATVITMTHWQQKLADLECRSHHDLAWGVQVWQWLRHGAKLDGGSVLTTARFAQILDEEMTKLRSKVGIERFDKGHFSQAIRLFDEFSTSERLSDFLTLPAYDYLVQQPPSAAAKL